MWRVRVTGRGPRLPRAADRASGADPRPAINLEPAGTTTAFTACAFCVANATGKRTPEAVFARVWERQRVALPTRAWSHRHAETIKRQRPRSLKAFTATDNRGCSPPRAHHARAIYGDRCKHQQQGSELQYWNARRGQRGVHTDSARPRCELRWWRGEHCSSYSSSFGASRRFRIRWPL